MRTQEEQTGLRIMGYDGGKRCSCRGFTLIELLVVIAIIALLMAVLMPALMRVKKQAKAAVCQASLRQWGMFFSIYMEDAQVESQLRHGQYLDQGRRRHRQRLARLDAQFQGLLKNGEAVTKSENPAEAKLEIVKQLTAFYKD